GRWPTLVRPWCERRRREGSCGSGRCWGGGVEGRRGGGAAGGEDREASEGGGGYGSSNEHLPPGPASRGERGMTRGALHGSLHVFAKVRVSPHLARIEKGKRRAAWRKVAVTWHAGILYEQRNNRDLAGIS